MKTSTGPPAPNDQPARSLVKRTAPLKTVDKALNTLDFLGVFGGQVGVRELAEYLGINKSSTHRLLTTLERHGYVAQDPITGKYQLGMRIFEAGAVVLSQMNLRAAAGPHIERLARETGEVVHLAVENGDHCVYLDKIKGANAVQTASQLGWRKPLYCTGVGKVLLANLPDFRIEQILREQELLPLTPHTVTDPASLAAELQEIRTSGIAFDREEIEVGLRCVAAPIVGAGNRVVAAVSLSVPSTRFGPMETPRLVQLIKETSQAISRDLQFGWSQSRLEKPTRSNGGASRR